jgi:hypothetical protein
LDRFCCQRFSCTKYIWGNSEKEAIIEKENKD